MKKDTINYLKRILINYVLPPSKRRFKKYHNKNKGDFKMIEETVFTNEKIIEVVKKNYNIDVYQVEKLNRGSANLYSLNENIY